uniref:Large ribosomal subunit protein bL32c n=2 Tax=Cunninghamia lanceolata TaxID=28977 RepID=A0A7R7I2X9_CUNLA|nr:ribosomal protein L32 [Cunninghamia lanceolata]AGL11012.1 ribosomal protein L32 [Cunninghamia lanceolata]BCK52202.1 ribosomal protein L32 [Cunninghamia lanceolata var. konishii]
MAVPKKRTSKSKKKIRNDVWKRKAYRAAAKAFSLVKGEYIYSELELFGDFKKFPEMNLLSSRVKGFSPIAEDKSSGLPK